MNKQPILCSLRRRILVPLAALALLAPLPLAAGNVAKDIKVAARALGFLSERPKGAVPMAVVFDPADARSKAAADAVMTAMGGGLKSGDITLAPNLLPIDQLDGLGGARVALLVEGIGAAREQVFAEASRLKVLTVSLDRECAQAGQCVMAVASEPRVEIVVNRAAAERSGISFAPAFRMMITEL